MAEPNVTGSEPAGDPGWLKINFDDGSDFHVHDPDGSYKAQVDDIVSKTGAADDAGKARAAADEFSPQALQATAVPDLSVAKAAANDFSPAALADAAQAPPAPANPASAFSSGVPTAATPPPPVPASAGPIIIPGTAGRTEREDSSQTSGLSKKDKAEIGGLQASAAESQKAADASTVATQTAVREHAYNTAVAHQAELQGQYDQQKTEAAHRQQLVDDETKRIQAINAKPIDPQAAFRGNDLGAFALLASIGQAISNFGARISGHGEQAEDTMKPITDIVDRSVKIQTAQKQADFEAGKITLAEYTAQNQAATSHLYALAGQLTLAQQHSADTEEEKMGIASLNSQLQAKRDAAAVDSAKALADHTVSTTRKTLTPGVGAHEATPAETAVLYAHLAEVSKNDPQLGRLLASKMGIDMGSGGEGGAAPIKALDPEEKKDVRTRLDGISEVVNNIREIDKNVGLQRDQSGAVTGTKNGDKVFGFGRTMEDAAHALPFHIGEAAEGAMKSSATPEASNIRGARDLLAAAKAKANFARTTEVELGLMQKQLPLGDAKQFAEGVRRTEEEARQTVKNMRAQYGNAYVDSELKQRGIDPGQF